MFGIDVTGLREVSRAMERIGRIANSRELPRRVAQGVRRQNLERFGRQTDPDGNPWEPLASGRASPPMLVKSGALSDFEIFTAPGSGDVGTRAPWAAFHQAGNAKLPRREFLGVAVGDVPALERIACDVVERLARV